MSNQIVLKIFSVLLFIALMSLGLRVAAYKPLWGDEIFSQVENIHKKTYGEILLGKLNEGNTCPLFYLIQKAVSEAVAFEIPQGWFQWERNSTDLKACLWLRAPAVFFMALGIVVMFFYFVRFHSWGTGFYSLFLSLSSYMVWAYWAEARHYAMWFAWTAIQVVVYLRLVSSSSENKDGLWKALWIVHLLMALTVVFTIAQIFIACLLLWVNNQRRMHKYLLINVIPLLIGCYYYAIAPKFQFWLRGPAWDLIAPNFYFDRLIWMGLGGLVVLILIGRGKKDPSLMETLRPQQQGIVIGLSMFVLGLILLGLFKYGDTRGSAGFELSYRYFIFLTPISIIVSTLSYSMMLKLTQAYPWVRFNLGVVFWGVSLISFYKYCYWAIGVYFIF